MKNVLQLFELVQKSVLVFATTVNKPNEPIMYPSPNAEGKSTSKHPYCKENLIHVKFVKVTQDSLTRAKRCAHTQKPKELDLEPIDTFVKHTHERYVVVSCLHNYVSRFYFILPYILLSSPAFYYFVML